MLEPCLFPLAVAGSALPPSPTVLLLKKGGELLMTTFARLVVQLRFLTHTLGLILCSALSPGKQEPLAPLLLYDQAVLPVSFPKYVLRALVSYEEQSQLNP